MRTVHYSEILYGTAALAGLSPGDLDAAAFGLLRTFHDRRLQVAWEIHRWPDVCPIEQRYYRPLYAAATAYVAGNERYDLPTGHYFQALRATTGNAPTVAGVENSAYWAECKNGYDAPDWVTNTAYAVGAQVKDPLTGYYYQVHTIYPAAIALIDLTKLGRLTPFNRYIPYTQTGSTSIGEFLTATNRDPRITTQTTSFPFWLSADGAQFSSPAPNTLWLYFRTRRDTLTGNAWDSTAAYASGDQVYFAATSGGVGDFYTANQSTTAGQSPATSAAKWTVVSLPYFLRGYLIQGGFADWLISDGQTDKAAAHEAFALEFLELEADKLQRQQQQVGRLKL